jgi:hypothetical protein
MIKLLNCSGDPPTGSAPQNHLLVDLGLFDDLDHRLVQLVDDGPWRAVRSKNQTMNLPQNRNRFQSWLIFGSDLERFALLTAIGTSLPD